MLRGRYHMSIGFNGVRMYWLNKIWRTINMRPCVLLLFPPLSGCTEVDVQNNVLDTC